MFCHQRAVFHTLNVFNEFTELGMKRNLCIIYNYDKNKKSMCTYLNLNEEIVPNLEIECILKKKESQRLLFIFVQVRTRLIQRKPTIYNSKSIYIESNKFM